MKPNEIALAIILGVVVLGIIFGVIFGVSWESELAKNARKRKFLTAQDAYYQNTRPTFKINYAHALRDNKQRLANKMLKECRKYCKDFTDFGDHNCLKRSCYNCKQFSPEEKKK